MSEPFLAEVKIVGFNFAPRGWAFCDGQILSIDQNQSLFALLGTFYGGDGRTTFALPDIQGRTPIHLGSSNGGRVYSIGQKFGEETHTLSASEMPAHDHDAEGSANDGAGFNPANMVLAKATVSTYTGASNLVNMNAEAVANVGGGQGHENMMPFITLNYCIALRGLFPSRN